MLVESANGRGRTRDRNVRDGVQTRSGTSQERRVEVAPGVDSGDGPTTWLPHRPPFLFVDEILDVVPGQSARGRWSLSGDEWFFAGHFPGRPTLPGS
jgi:hypothetical protein